MVNGPPTPPPMSATELSDATRSSGQPQSASGMPNTTPVAPPLRSDIYQTVLPTIADLVTQGDYSSVIQLCERNDLNGDGDNSPTRFFVTAPLVIAYLIVDNLAPAQYVLNRLPDNLVSHPLAKSLYDLLRSTRERKHSLVYSQAESLFNEVQQPDFLDAKLGLIIAALVTTFIESFRGRTFVLLCKAYSSLPVSLAQSYLGWSSEQLLATASRNGWSHDEATQILSPSSDTGSLTSKPDAAGPSSLETFSLVAANVAQLEA